MRTQIHQGQSRGRILKTLGSNFLRMGLSWVTFIFTGVFLHSLNYLQRICNHEIRKGQLIKCFMGRRNECSGKWPCALGGGWVRVWRRSPDADQSLSTPTEATSRLTSLAGAWAGLCTVECSAASLASTCHMPAALQTKNVSSHCQMPPGEQIPTPPHPVDHHWCRHTEHMSV